MEPFINDILFIDTETTGLIARESCVIQLGAVMGDPNKKENRFLVDIYADHRPYSAMALRVTKTLPGDIRPEWKKEDGPTRLKPREAVDQFLTWLYTKIPNDYKAPRITLGGHNVIKFDFPHLDELFLSAGVSGFLDMFDYHAIDTFSLARAMRDAGLLNYPSGPLRSLSLSAVSKFLGIGSYEEHNALADAIVSQKTYYEMVKRLRGAVPAGV